VIEAGVRDGVKCRLCGAEGRIRVKSNPLTGGRQHVDDYIPHTPECELYKRPQPRHLAKDRKRWAKQEQRANDLVGARATPASGALNQDGDGRLLGKWRTESKQTKRKVYPLRQTVWAKLLNGAAKAGEEPMLHVELAEYDRRVIVRKSWYDARSQQEPSVDQTCVNEKSYRVEASAKTPHLIQLDPPGVMLYESEFAELKGEEE
jgi:hypothetical protein